MRSPSPSATDPRAADAVGLRIAVVVARYHRNVTDRLVSGAVAAFAQRGGDPACLLTIDAPGTFELPVLCRAALDRGDVHAAVALGCVIRGETPHDLVIAQAVADALQRLAVDTGKAVSFGVLTCLTIAQAEDRAGGRHGNKGEEAMHAALDTALSLRRVHTGDAVKTERS